MSEPLRQSIPTLLSCTYYQDITRTDTCPAAAWMMMAKRASINDASNLLLSKDTDILGSSSASRGSAISCGSTEMKFGFGSEVSLQYHRD